MKNCADIRVPCRAVEVTGLRAGLGRLFLASLKTLHSWYERSKQRRRLAQLDDHLLRDIGIDRVAAMKEAYKPFWRE